MAVMSEMHKSFESNGKQPISTLLERFKDDLLQVTYDAIDFDNDLADSYDAIDARFKEYVQSELGFTAEEVDTFVAVLRREGKLPNEDYFKISPQASIDSYRLEVFRSVAPIYRLQHTCEEYECWLRSVMQFVAPKMGRHDLEACSWYISPLDDECYFGECPVKVMLNEVVAAITKPDFTNLEYQIDPEKASWNAQRALSTASYCMKFIPKNEKDKLRDDYRKEYESAFPGSSQ